MLLCARRAACSALCLVAFASATNSSRAQSAQVQQLFQQGAAAMRSGQPAAAEHAFREAVRLEPRLPEAHTDLALVLGREGKLDEAIDTLRQSLVLSPVQPGANLYLGIFLFQTNHAAEARTALQQATAQAPGNVEAWMWLGNVDMASGHPELAVASFDRAAELTPDDLNLLELRGRAHNQVAHDSYARMARLDPNSWHVHRVQAQLYADGGKHAEAITEYKAALQQQPNNPDLYEALGDEYRASSQMDGARSAYQKELELAPANPIALYNLGSVEVELGNGPDGVRLLQQMVAAYPGSPVAEYYLGRGLALTGQDEASATWFERSAAADPDGEIGKRSFYELSRVDRKLHRTADAEKALAGYNRIRLVQESRSAQQVQDWKKVTQAPAGVVASDKPSQ
jgi:tetratricopeptide (TPR) repeat protein